MSTSDLVCVTRRTIDRDTVVTVAINRANKLNALNSATMQAFVDAMAAVSREAEVRAVIVTGDGERAFVGGADIKEMGALTGAGGARAFITRVHKCCAAVRDCPVPVFARINGLTFGAGLELAAACDMRIAADTAKFGMPEVHLGIPSVVEAALLPGLIGWGRTRRLLLLGETIDAKTAETWGLVETVTTGAGLDAAVDAALRQLLKATPQAIRLQKALIRRWENLPLGEAVRAGIDSFASAFEGDEPATAMAAFHATEARRKGKA